MQVSIVRGGTSKGVYLTTDQLPDNTNPEARDRLILALLGSPDARQIDGLGGAEVLTSKLAIVGKSNRSDADVEYTFGQVSIDRAFVDYKGNCGNILSGVGPFAIHAGLMGDIDTQATTVNVRVYVCNVDCVVTLTVPVHNGNVRSKGDYSIDGVPGTGARIDCDWKQCGGAITGKILPTGNVTDVITSRGKEYTVSVVDAGNVTVCVNARCFGLSGDEDPLDLETNTELLSRIESLRGEVCVRLGLVSKAEQAVIERPFAPFVSLVSAKSPDKVYSNSGRKATPPRIDVYSQMFFMQKPHKAHAITGSVAVATLGRITRSVVHQIVCMNDSSPKHNLADDSFFLGHPSGYLTLDTAVSMTTEGDWAIQRMLVPRTARVLMTGTAYCGEI